MAIVAVEEGEGPFELVRGDFLDALKALGTPYATGKLGCSWVSVRRRRSELRLGAPGRAARGFVELRQGEPTGLVA